MSKTAEIQIDMNKACTKCGEMGAYQNGLCIECAFGKKYGAGLEYIDLINNAIASASRQLKAHLATQSLHIHSAYYGAEDSKLTIGLSVELEPSKEVPDEINVKAKINFIETRIKDESSERVSRQEKLNI